MFSFCIPSFIIKNKLYRFVTYLIFGVPINQLVFSLIIYMNRTFTGIHLWCGIVTLLVLPFYFIMPESPRWLAQNNNEKQALKVILNMAKINNKSISDDDKNNINKLITEIAKETHETETILTPLDMFKHNNMTKTMILFFSWTMSCISFYGLSLNSARLSGNIILNFVLMKVDG